MSKKIINLILGIGIIATSFLQTTFAYFAQNGDYYDIEIDEDGYYDNSYNDNYYYYNNNIYKYYDNYSYIEYEYDRPKEYYTVTKYLDYDLSNCYYDDKDRKYCSITLEEYRESIYNQQDCHYKFSDRKTYCLFNFTKTKKLINDYDYKYNYYYDDLPSSNLNRYIYIPKNAHLDGSDWECDSGYYQDGNKCKKIDIPRNAHLSSNGRNWECDSGYSQDGDECEKIYVPNNAHIDGNSWSCNIGYRKSLSGNYCIIDWF